MAEQELKACPMCADGGRPYLYGQETVDAFKNCRTCCEVCGATTGHYRKRSEAASAWNTRPLESAITARLSSAEAEVERLRGRNAALVDSVLEYGASPNLLVTLGVLTTDELAAATARRQQGGTDGS